MSGTVDLYAVSQRKLVASLLYQQQGDVDSASEELASVLGVVSADDFEDPSSEILFRAINRATARSEIPTPVVVAQELEKQGLLGRIGGIGELYQLRKEGQVARREAPPRIYADEVKKGAVRRSAERKMEESKPLLSADSGLAVTEVVGDLVNSLNNDLTRMGDKGSSTDLSDAINNYTDLLALRRERSEANGGEEGGGLQGIITPLPSLNRWTMGWMPEQLITIGARTGIGKSIFAVNAATAAASTGASVLFFSLEMSQEELMDRLISSITQVSQSRLKNGYVTEEEIARINDHAEDIRSMKIKVDTDPRVTVETIRAKAMQMANSPMGLDFIIVDYLQLINGGTGRRTETRQEIVSNLSREMKLLAKQLKVPVMILVQLNREGKKEEENPLPTLDNIRESGAIGQDSNVVILLHRDKEITNEAEPPKTKVILAKNRNGPANRIITCSSFLSTSTFKEVTTGVDSIVETDEDIDALLEDGLNDDDDVDDFDDLGWDE